MGAFRGRTDGVAAPDGEGVALPLPDPPTRRAVGGAGGEHRAATQRKGASSPPPPAENSFGRLKLLLSGQTLRPLAPMWKEGGRKKEISSWLSKTSFALSSQSQPRGNSHVGISGRYYMVVT